MKKLLQRTSTNWPWTAASSVCDLSPYQQHCRAALCLHSCPSPSPFRSTVSLLLIRQNMSLSPVCVQSGRNVGAALQPAGLAVWGGGTMQRKRRGQNPLTSCGRCRKQHLSGVYVDNRAAFAPISLFLTKDAKRPIILCPIIFCNRIFHWKESHDRPRSLCLYVLFHVVCCVFRLLLYFRFLEEIPDQYITIYLYPAVVNVSGLWAA